MEGRGLGKGSRAQTGEDLVGPVSADPEAHLQWMAGEALGRASAGQALLGPTTGLQATANAFVVLGLLSEERAEAVLAGHRRALQAKEIELRGVESGELTLLPGSAHGYW
ncbi:MAG: hypothetical protein ACRDZQ_07215, partial [Acidimicrobiales bacterium]